jgi:hypothetical protein
MIIFQIYDHDNDDQINFKEFSDAIFFQKSMPEDRVNIVLPKKIKGHDSEKCSKPQFFFLIFKKFKKVCRKY